MLRTTAMSKDDIIEETEVPKAKQDSMKVSLSVSKTVARRLGRVTRWERESEGTSLELTGRS